MKNRCHVQISGILPKKKADSARFLELKNDWDPKYFALNHRPPKGVDFLARRSVNKHILKMKEGETMDNIPDSNKIYTYADWKTWEGRWELINGKAYNMTPAPSTEHQFAVGELYFALRHFFQNKHGDSHRLLCFGEWPPKSKQNTSLSTQAGVCPLLIEWPLTPRSGRAPQTKVHHP
ncbi:hypothetical protein HNR34_003703 [Geobacillus subterraneus]